MDTSTVIQAGGQSRRMGRDKGLVPLAGRPLVAHVVDRVGGLTDELLLTTNRPADYAFLGLPGYADETPGAGALYGLQTALRAARGELVLLVGCDMPFLQPALLRALLSGAAASGAAGAAPVWQGRLQPLVAVYRRSTSLPAVDVALAAGQRRLTAFLQELSPLLLPEDDVRRYDPTGDSFVNINTPQELAAAESRLRGG